MKEVYVIPDINTPDKYTHVGEFICMETIVVLSKKAEKDLRKIPKHILIQFDFWV